MARVQYAPRSFSWPLLLVLVAVGLLGAAWWVWQSRSQESVPVQTKEALGSGLQWTAQKPTYVAGQPPAPPAAPDELAEIKQLLLRQQQLLEKQQQEIAALEKRKPSQQTAPAPKKEEKPTPARWVMGGASQATPPFPKPAPPTAAAPDSQGQLIQPAQWEAPEEPWKVLYSSQAICGQMLETTDSRLPSQVKIQVGQDVKDKFGQNHTLLPQFATVIGAHDGSTTHGETALLVGIKEVQFPGPPWGKGEVLTLPGRMTDKSGAVGAGAHINWHLGKMALGVLFNAALGVGPRIATGGTSGYHYTPVQDITREATAEAQRAAQKVIEKTFFLKPTLTFNAGDAVCVQLAESVSLARPPTVIK